MRFGWRSLPIILALGSNAACERQGTASSAGTPSPPAPSAGAVSPPPGGASSPGTSFPGSPPSAPNAVASAADTAPSAAAAKGWPATCDEAAARALSEMSPELKQRVRALSKDQLILLHDSWGTGIRNEFGLWRGNTELLASCAAASADTAAEPDPVAMLIITKTWGLLQAEKESPHGGH